MKKFENEITIAKECVELAQSNYASNNKNSAKWQLLGVFIGCKMSLELLEKWCTTQKLSRKERRKLSHEKDKWLLGDYINKFENIDQWNEFAYEIAIQKIIKTLELILGETDYDEWSYAFNFKSV